MTEQKTHNKKAPTEGADAKPKAAQTAHARPASPACMRGETPSKTPVSQNAEVPPPPPPRKPPRRRKRARGAKASGLTVSSPMEVPQPADPLAVAGIREGKQTKDTGSNGDKASSDAAIALQQITPRPLPHDEAEDILAHNDAAKKLSDIREPVLPKVKNVSSTKKPESRFGQIKNSRVIYESDFVATKKRFIPSHIRAGAIYAVCVAVLLVALWNMGTYLIEVINGESQFEEVKDSYVATDPMPVSEQTDASSWPPIIDFDKLKAANPDVAGWLRIPGTTVDYPIMTNEKTDYYLHRDMYGNYSYPGSIFADHQNANDLKDGHVVLYGHHMRPPTMFHDVANYADPAFFKKHRTVYVETPETTYVCRAIAMYTVDPSEYETRQVVFEDGQTFQSFLDRRLSRTDNIEFEDYNRKTTDKLISLVTCNNTGKARQIVECVVEQQYPTSMIPNVIATAMAEQKED